MCDGRGQHLIPEKPRDLAYARCTSTHAALQRTLPWHQQDPVDHMLERQPMVENLTFLSADKPIEQYPVMYI